MEGNKCTIKDFEEHVRDNIDAFRCAHCGDVEPCYKGRECILLIAKQKYNQS